ncbi:MAG: NAD-dependent epimerase/dehydratase family protein [Pseudomonadota bacterium]
MKTPMHVVLGASGATGRAVVNALLIKNLPCKAVGRSKINPAVETVNANLLDPLQVKKVLENATHVYVCVGLPYQSEVWLRDWPLLMKYVIAACAEYDVKIIFFDDIYMYGPAPLDVPFDENHQQNPTTKKGIARKHTADLLLKALQENKVQGVIGRSADFYGPYAVNSPFYIYFLERMLKGQAPIFMTKTNVPHTYANAIDNANALVALALDPRTYGEVWHLPVGPPVTLEQVMNVINKELKTNFKAKFLPGIVRNVSKFFISSLKEVDEMLYQFNNEYVMSFDKFQKHFPEFLVTPYDQGIKAMINSFQESPTTASLS